MIEENIKTWDRKKGETNRSYNAFLCYRNMGALRSLRKAAEQFYDVENIRRTSAKLRQFTSWSAKHNWVVRCVDWDTEQDRIFLLEQREAIREMNKRQATYGKAMQKKGMTAILDIDATTLTPDQSARFTKEGVAIERTALGEAAEVTEHKGKVELETQQLDPAIAKEAAKLITKMQSEQSIAKRAKT